MAKARSGMPRTVNNPAPAEILAGDDFERLSTPGRYVAEVATDPQAFELLSVGLYREPASAIRELISNAYDADATRVEIEMNPPVFDRIVVRDNGRGMTRDALHQVIRNVGGSLKRRAEGEKAGITGDTPGYSPGGRPLIGKLGIGLYSVRHMTNHFRITTKEAESDLRYVAEVRLRERPAEDDPPEEYVAGTATIVSERAANSEHYTIIELLDVTAEAKNTLRSYDRWEQYAEADEIHRRGQMRFHIARLSRDVTETLAEESLPWTDESTPLDRFRAMVGRFSEKEELVLTGPAVDLVLDYYFAMIWKIAHSAPLDYVDKSPFALTAEDNVDIYSLEGDATPERLPPPPPGKTVADVTGVSELGVSPTPFTVFLDDLELRRPVVFQTDEHLYSPRQMIRRPKLFVGRFDSEAERDRRTGWAGTPDEDPDAKPLVFSAYFWWAPKIVPKENNGLLTRIRNSSGTGFDHSFADYRTSELTRVRQVSSEVFVELGLDDALNIDRESFNNSHPHYRAMQMWVHRQLTRIMSRLKADQKRVRDEKLEHDLLEEVESVDRTARGIWSARRADAGENAPSVVVTAKLPSRRTLFDQSTLYIGGVQGPAGNIEKDERLSATLRGLTLVLDAYGLLDDLSAETRAQLLSDIAAVLTA